MTRPYTYCADRAGMNSHQLHPAVVCFLDVSFDTRRHIWARDASGFIPILWHHRRRGWVQCEAAGGHVSKTPRQLPISALRSVLGGILQVRTLSVCTLNKDACSGYRRLRKACLQ